LPQLQEIHNTIAEMMVSKIFVRVLPNHVLSPSIFSPVFDHPYGDAACNKIMANGYVASKIFDSFPESALLRIHRSVEQSRFDSLKNVLDVGGVTLDGSSNRALATTLKEVEKADAVVKSLIKSLATR
jgi:hypothetical protein